MALPFIKRAGAAEDKRLVVYNFDGVLGQAVKDLWIAPFAKKNGVTIDTITMTGSSPPMAKIKAEIDAGRPDADVIPMQLTDHVFATRNNMLQTIDRGGMPEYANLYPQFITDNGPGLIIWCYGLAYNTEKIKTPPTSWRDLWNPAYKSKVALNEALFEQALQMVNLTFTGKPTPVDDATFKHLGDLKPNLLTLWTTGAQAEQLLRTGEVWMTPLWNGRVFTLKDQGVPLDFVVPKEGFFVRYDPYCIPKGARNPGLAKEWVNFICNEAPQRELAEKLYYASPNKLVRYPPELAKRVVVSSPEVLKKAVTEDFAAIVDHLAEWRQRWDAWKQS
ncbi:MAG TPA: ABC transporter substrate-binding protein [Alphaproteobacteria bacterium]|nr:ABC transporter substrate-binding protein [Alphaproteobacteria bacterium]